MKKTLETILIWLFLYSIYFLIAEDYRYSTLNQDQLWGQSIDIIFQYRIIGTTMQRLILAESQDPIKSLWYIYSLISVTAGTYFFAYLRKIDFDTRESIIGAFLLITLKFIVQNGVTSQSSFCDALVVLAMSAALYYFENEDFLMFTIFSIIGVLTKEVFVIIFLFLYFKENPEPEKKFKGYLQKNKIYKSIKQFLLPIIILMGWRLYVNLTFESEYGDYNPFMWGSLNPTIFDDVWMWHGFSISYETRGILYTASQVFRIFGILWIFAGIYIVKNWKKEKDARYTWAFLITLIFLETINFLFAEFYEGNKHLPLFFIIIPTALKFVRIVLKGMK